MTTLKDKQNHLANIAYKLFTSDEMQNVQLLDRRKERHECEKINLQYSNITLLRKVLFENGTIEYLIRFNFPIPSKRIKKTLQILIYGYKKKINKKSVLLKEIDGFSLESRFFDNTSKTFKDRYVTNESIEELLELMNTYNSKN